MVKLPTGDAGLANGSGVGGPPSAIAQVAHALAIPLPKDLVSRNVLIEVTAAGRTRSHPYYANAMNVRLLENYGQLLVIESANTQVVAKGSPNFESRAQDPRACRRCT
jgi:hypothetical protein